MALNAGKFSLRALFVQGWNEIPEVMGAGVMGLLGWGIAGAALYKYYKNDGDNRKYKMSYIVYRPEDPRAAKVHRD